MITDEDFEYFSENEFEEKTKNDIFENKSEEKIEDIVLIHEKNNYYLLYQKIIKKLEKLKK